MVTQRVRDTSWKGLIHFSGFIMSGDEMHEHWSLCSLSWQKKAHIQCELFCTSFVSVTRSVVMDQLSLLPTLGILFTSFLYFIFLFSVFLTYHVYTITLNTILPLIPMPYTCVLSFTLCRYDLNIYTPQKVLVVARVLPWHVRQEPNPTQMPSFIAFRYRNWRPRIWKPFIVRTSKAVQVQWNEFEIYCSIHHLKGKNFIQPWLTLLNRG